MTAVKLKIKRFLVRKEEYLQFECVGLTNETSFSIFVL